MFKHAWVRLKQGHRTIGFPESPPMLPEGFRGRLAWDRIRCNASCRACEEVCPTEAISARATSIDYGRCIFCNACVEACPEKALAFTQDYRLSCKGRENLIANDGKMDRAVALSQELRRILGRALYLRQVSAGGCNGCEVECNVLTTVVFDLSRFGIQFVASPRHADGLLVTGPVTKNMELALKKTYAAVPDPKIIIAVGACAISGGIYRGHEEACDGVTRILPVDLFVPGCPPHPITILDGLLGLIGKIRDCV